MAARALLERVWRDVGPYRAEFAGAMGATLAATGVTLLLPLGARWLIEDAYPSGDTVRMVAVLGLLLIVVAVSLALSALRRFLMERLCLRIMAAWRDRLFAHLLSLTPRALQSAEGGRVLTGFTSDLAMLRESLRALLATVLPLSVIVIIYASAMIWFSWMLSLAFLVMILPLVLVTHHFGRRIHSAAHRAYKGLGGLVAEVSEVLAGSKEIKLFGMEARVIERHGQRNQETLAAHVHREAVMALHPFAVSLLVAVGVAAIILLSMVLMGRGLITASGLAGFMVCLGLGYPPMQELGAALGQAFQLAAAYERVEALTTMPPERDGIGLVAPAPAPATAPAPARIGRAAVPLIAAVPPIAAVPGIAFRGVGFGYGGGFALADITLDIARGEHVALVGPSGAGKSTLLELLPRFIEPNAGRIEIDGQDIANMPLAALRAKIGLVTQVPYLFAGSLMDNLRAASPGAKSDAVAEAVRLARVDEFAHRLPQGLDSLIESGGTNLSVGQRQRIALARVFLKDPPILLLDEPTSALDAASERFVADAIVQAAANRTTITVAHRLSTVRDADRVVVMDAGRIVEIGTHAHLLAQGGAFAGLTRASAVVAS